MDKKVFKVFLASSNELIEEREKLTSYIKSYYDSFVEFEVIIWEEMLKSFTPGGIQERISHVLKECEIVIFLFNTKVGKYTKIEFDVALDGINNKLKHLFFYYADVEKENYKLELKNIIAMRGYVKLLRLIDNVEKQGQIAIEFDSIDSLLTSINKQLRIIGDTEVEKIKQIEY